MKTQEIVSDRFTIDFMWRKEKLFRSLATMDDYFCNITATSADKRRIKSENAFAPLQESN